MMTSEEEGGGGDKERRAKKSKASRGRSASTVVSSGAGDAAAAAVGVGVGSKKAKAVRPRASSGGGGGGGGRNVVTGVAGGGCVRASPVWEFFSTSPADKTIAVCTLCSQRLSRGRSGTNVGTTALLQHMKRHHLHTWKNRIGQQCQQDHPPPPCHHSSSQARSPSSTLSVLSSSSPSTSSTASPAPPPTPTLLPPPTPPPPYRRQSSITECLGRKQQYAPGHPVVCQLNSHLAKLLVVQSLPYHLVDSTAFRQMMACAQPRWRIPSRHYFSKKAVPALYSHVAENVGRSLRLSLCGKVHATTDTWSSNYGQGQYMSFTAHWVNVLRGSGDDAPPQQSQVLVTPPRLCRSGSDTRRFSTPSTSSSMDIFPSPTATGQSVASTPPSFHMCKLKRCHAVLHLMSLGERSHTAGQLLFCIEQQISRWMTPSQLRLGNVVSDNGRNIVAALHLGKITHAPCMAHVINLVVQRFLKTYRGLQKVLTMARRVSAHFSRSYVAKNALLDLQRQNGLPLHRLICDVPTRWNSTLQMLDRLYEQRKAVNDYIMHQTAKAGSMCYFELRQWQLIRDACRLLRPFEEATRFVSRDNSGINDVIPLIFILEQTLTLMQQGMEEEQLPHLARRPVAVGDPRGGCPVQEEVEEDEELGLEEEEEEEEEEELVLEGDMELSQAQLGDEADPQCSRHDDGDGDDDDYADHDQPYQWGAENQTTGSSDTLASMASCMLACLRADKRIVSIKQRDDYWIAMLLDPRYKSKMGEFFPASQRETKLAYYQDTLCTQLAAAFAEQTPAGRVSDEEAPLRSPLSGRSAASAGATAKKSSRSSSTSSSSQYSLLNMMEHFFQLPRQPEAHQERDTHRLNNQVQSYLDCALGPADTLSPDPMDFWVTRVDQWQELAQFAIHVLSCPPSSVLSERVFSAAGGVVTPKRTKLSTTSVEHITFVKMNQAWISEDFHTPPPDVND